jgi:predicted transcriptional regulator
MPKSPVELTEAEWHVIKAVWDREPCTAPEIQERLLGATGWTYSTVRTVMDRMVVKGLLAAKKEGKLTVFKSAVTRQQAQCGELRYTLKHAFDNALTPMVQCLLNTRGLTSKELDELDALIRAHRKRQP